LLIFKNKYASVVEKLRILSKGGEEEKEEEEGRMR
jgi:hypothetical protein